MPGRPTVWKIVGQGPTALSVGVCVGCLDILLSSILSLIGLPLFGKRPLNPKQPTNKSLWETGRYRLK